MKTGGSMVRMRAQLAGLAIAGVLAFAASCGDDVPESLITPCESMPGKCGATCMTDANCSPGTYCSVAGTCTADCTPSGNQCGVGNSCMPNGRCQSGINLDGSAGSGSGDGSVRDGCVNVTLQLKKTVPTVVLLVDQSGSMTEGFSGGNRWDVLRDALMDAQTGIVARLENDVRFGLALYSSRDENSDGVVEGACPLLTEVAVALGNYQAINNIYAGADPIDETPTGDSLRAVATDLIPMQSDGPKVIVLATDGEPDTCEQPNPQNGQAESIAAAEFAHQNNIQTYIISVGEGTVSLGHLQDMANAGQGLPVGGAQNAEYYEANNQAALEQAFNEIINGVRDCRLKLNGQVDASKASQGRVTLDGQPLGFEDANGWRLNNPTEIELLGTACEAIKTGDHDVRVVFPCGVVTTIPQ
jgi:hypothetical protein